MADDAAGLSRRDGARPSDRELSRQLAGEVAAIREELSGLVEELDRRRHRALDLPRQVKRHAREVALAGLGVAAGVSLAIWLVVRRSGRRAGPFSRAARLREAVSRMTELPERAAESRDVATQILAAAATAAAVTVTRRLVGEGLARVVDQRHAEPPRRVVDGNAGPP